MTNQSHQPKFEGPLTREQLTLLLSEARRKALEPPPGHAEVVISTCKESNAN